MGKHKSSSKATQKDLDLLKVTELYKTKQLFKSVDTTMSAPTPELLWGNWIVKNTIIIQSGSGGVSKTSFNYSLVTNLQDSGEFLGIKGKKNLKIIYFDLESNESLIKARLNLIGKLDKPHPDFIYCNEIITIDLLEACVNQFIKDHWTPDIIFIDPISMCLDMADENDNVEATEKMKMLRTMVNNWHTTLVMVDHSGKGDMWGVGNSRGASSKGNLADIVWTYHPLPKEYGDDKFILHIPKNRFINDGFLQCILKIEGDFEPCEFPSGFDKDKLKSTGIKTYAIQEQIEKLMMDGKFRTAQEIMTDLSLSEESQRVAVYRALTPLLQKQVLTRVARGVYQLTIAALANDYKNAKSKDVLLN